MNIKKNGIISSNGFSDTTPIQDMETKVLSDGSAWARIFMHNCVGGSVLFTSYNEVMNTQTANKYSRLYLMDAFRANDGKFEFMLCYPDDTSNYNRWKQSNNPCKEYKGTSDGSLYADGYQAISIAWGDHFWGGLTRQNSGETVISPCFLSGSVGHNNWFYAIGASESWNGGIPAYGPATNKCELWARIDTLPKQAQLKLYHNFITSANFIEL